MGITLQTILTTHSTMLQESSQSFEKFNEMWKKADKAMEDISREGTLKHWSKDEIGRKIKETLHDIYTSYGLKPVSKNGGEESLSQRFFNSVGNAADNVVNFGKHTVDYYMDNPEMLAGISAASALGGGIGYALHRHHNLAKKNSESGEARKNFNDNTATSASSNKLYKSNLKKNKK